MTPAVFLAEVTHPNMVAALTEPVDMREIVNAILSLDALVGIVHAHARAEGQREIAALRDDDAYREVLAGISPSYRVLRDTAASLKHGELTRPRKGLARLLKAPSAIETEANTLGFFEIDDEIGGDIILIRYDHNGPPGLVRASNIIAGTYRMLKRVVEGGPAETDEHDRGTFAVMGGPPAP